MNTTHKQLQETPSRDITKFIARFIAEIILTRQASHGLGSFFSFARTNAAKLIQKAQKQTKSVIQAATPEGIAIQANKVVKPTTGATKLKTPTKQKIVNQKKIIISNQELIRTFNITQYDASIGDLKKLEMAVEKLQNVEGALGTNGPLRNVLEFGKKGSGVGNLGTARGAMYELEKGLELIKNEFPLKFGKHLRFESTSREFDIITSKRLIECKNIDWSKITPGELAKRKGQFGNQMKIAKGLGKTFEVHSKWSIPDVLKQWFRKKGIPFIEG